MSFTMFGNRETQWRLRPSPKSEKKSRKGPRRRGQDIPKPQGQGKSLGWLKAFAGKALPSWIGRLARRKNDA